jgi:hypothetical protein
MTHRASEDNERATSKPVHIPTVLAVGCSEELLARCWEALAGQGLMVRDCTPVAAPNLAAMRQPLVIVMPSKVHAVDPEEFDALARDVRATLVIVNERHAPRDLAVTLQNAVRAATLRRTSRSSSSSGRYSILPGELSVAPAVSTRPGLAHTTPSEPPPTSAVRPAQGSLEEIEAELLAILR